MPNHEMPKNKTQDCTAGKCALENRKACKAAHSFRAFEREKRLYGEEGLQRLNEARVGVLGLGGVGSNCALALVRAGVGNLFVLDGDVVDITNINRQALAFHSTLGQPKTAVLRAMVANINPYAQVQTAQQFLLSSEVVSFFRTAPACDIWIDALDSIATKLEIALCSQTQGFSLISSMGIANKRDLSCLAIADIYQTVNDPIARIMRKEGRKRGITALLCAYSSEKPLPTQGRVGASRSERSNLGTNSYMPAIMGNMIAGYVIEQIVAHKL